MRYQVTFLDVVMVLAILVIIALEIWRNYYIIEVEKKRPNYLLSNIARLIVLIVGNYIYVKGFSPELTWLSVSLFGVLFDPILNKFRGKRLLYINPKGGWYDGLLTKLGVFYTLYVFAEVLVLITGVYIYFYYRWDGFVDLVTGYYMKYLY